MPQHRNIVIIGNGIAGITAARFIRKRSDAAITVISAESEHFFSRTALMYVYMGHESFEDIKPYEDFFWGKNRINLIQAFVESVDFDEKKCILSTGKDLHYDALILATGSTFNKFGWKGQDLEGVNGLYSLQDLEYLETYTHDAQAAAIVGGGLIGIELAEMLRSRNIETHLIVRESEYWDNVLPEEEASMISRHIPEHHIKLYLGTNLAEILPDERGRAKIVKTDQGHEIPVQFVGLTAGVHPKIDFLKNSKLETDKGILVNEYLQTNIENVYAIGDCAQLKNPPAGRQAIEAVWYVGRMMGETVALTLTGDRTKYEPGIWFNSAKFLDIEYQVYGDIKPKPADDEDTLYWEHPGGKKSVRINFKKEDKRVIGFNLMGIRLRHRVCEKWIHEGRSLKYVIEHLRAANFDPEFFTRHEKDVAQLYNSRFPSDPVKLKSRNKLKKLIFGNQF